MKKMISAVALALSLSLAFGCAPTVSKADKPAQSEMAAYQREGFETRMEHGRLWVFIPGSKDLAKYDKAGELAKHVVRPGKGPGGITIKGPDGETIDAYMLARPGFITRMEHGRLWVFKSGSPELAKFEKAGELAKHIVRPGKGPGGITVKGPDAETLDAYLAIAQ